MYLLFQNIRLEIAQENICCPVVFFTNMVWVFIGIKAPCHVVTIGCLMLKYKKKGKKYQHN